MCHKQKRLAICDRMSRAYLILILGVSLNAENRGEKKGAALHDLLETKWVGEFSQNVRPAILFECKELTQRPGAVTKTAA
jgi:hypothetical protein